MPKKQRVKGCFQCSTRRIDCDLAQPTCAKCKRKGIECSGLARIRFAPGLASRGKFKNASVPVVQPTSPSTSSETGRRPPGRSSPGSTPPDGSGGNRRPTELPPQQHCNISNVALGGRVLAENNGESCKTHQRHRAVDGHVYSGGKIVLDDGQQRQQQQQQQEIDHPGVVSMLQPWISPVPHQQRSLFAHFSQAVAPAMVVIDGLYNGYRNIILSMATTDTLLSRAVSVVAAQHIGLSHPAACEAARRGRAAVIQKLRLDACRLADTPHLVFTPSTWATLLILLVGETVTGGSEFQQLFRMLVAAAQNCDLDAQGIPDELRDFLSKQTHMFEIIGRPQLSTYEGVEIISRSLDSHLDWVSSDTNDFSDQSADEKRALSITRQAFREASRLYLSRATDNGSSSPDAIASTTAGDTDFQPTIFSSNSNNNTISQSPAFTVLPPPTLSVSRLRDLISSLDPTAHGAHALVWPCFVAAAESTDPGDRAFFAQRLKDIYPITQFQNIRAAVESLPQIWAMQDGMDDVGVDGRGGGHRNGNWTTRLSRISSTVIM